MDLCLIMLVILKQIILKQNLRKTQRLINKKNKKEIKRNKNNK